MAQQIIISVKNLTKKYGDFEAVKGISFDVYEGEIFGLLGPNGAGKSTTLEIIETLREKTIGNVIVDGIDLDKNPDEIKKIIGVQLQTSGYYPGLNLIELIELFGGLYNQPVKPLELLDMVNLRDKAKAKYKELSGGQKQRFSIATTLINDPKIIFFGLVFCSFCCCDRWSFGVAVVCKKKNVGFASVLTPMVFFSFQ